MTLDYKILWFEDAVEWYEAILPDISQHLTQKGFTLIPQREDNSNNKLESFFDDGSYDLILMDFNLLNEKGDVLIEKIRKMEIYTNIVFYSQSGEESLRTSVNEKHLDGVYCASREQNDFIDKVTNLINITIKKIEDLNNLRGLVMASVSELDLKVEELTIKLIDKLGDEEASEQKEIIKTKFLASLQERIDSINSIDIKNNFKDLVYKIEATHRINALTRICKKNEHLKEFVDILNDYKKEIITIRNILAHVCEEIDEAGNKVLKTKVQGYETFIFNEAEAIRIRTNIKKYIQTFSKIEEIL